MEGAYFLKRMTFLEEEHWEFQRVLSAIWNGNTWLLVSRLVLELNMLGLRSDNVSRVDPKVHIT
jgi:hypothetical protein